MKEKILIFNFYGDVWAPGGGKQLALSVCFCAFAISSCVGECVKQSVSLHVTWHTASPPLPVPLRVSEKHTAAATLPLEETLVWRKGLPWRSKRGSLACCCCWPSGSPGPRQVSLQSWRPVLQTEASWRHILLAP